MFCSVAAFVEENVAVFPVFDPRSTDLVLGLAIGLSLAMVCHWVSWAVH